MAKKPEAKPQKKMTQKKQSARFVKTARQLESDEIGKAFDVAVEKVLSPKSFHLIDIE